MAKRRVVAFLSLAAIGVLGCRVENPPTRREVEQERKSEHAQTAVPPRLPQDKPDRDDAARVLEACGRPGSDLVYAIYDKLYNGPVRRMAYRGRQVVTLEFIPSLPVAHQADIPAPFPPGERAPAAPPSNAIWRFQDAQMENQRFLTSRRFEIYLPCAAHALADEF